MEEDFDIGEYYFESDHLALKGNADYHMLLKTLAVLEAQRVKAIQDLDLLLEWKEKALVDPIGFVEKLQQKEDLGLPKSQCIAKVPTIDWSKYSLNGNQVAVGKRQLTRFSTRGAGDSCKNESQCDQKNGTPPPILVRGRVFEESKPATFNQLWTPEEQKKLEDLLIQFPPEEVESRRWEKIANALGNRTTTQVASRVQKYFIKLTKAGLPVPGRIPHMSNMRKSRRQYIRHPLQQHSTFFVSHTPTVYMTDGDDDNTSNSYQYSLPSSTEGDGPDRMESDDEEVSTDFMDSPEYQELLLLRKLRAEKVEKEVLTQHVGFKCDRCECDPIVGTRWHCIDCPDNAAVDFCSECVDCGLETQTHNSDHRIEPVFKSKGPVSFLDGDYMQASNINYNYLDPNYMPAV